MILEGGAVLDGIDSVRGVALVACDDLLVVEEVDSVVSFGWWTMRKPLVASSLSP